ncbi:formate/nitrite transporter family protein [Dietzia maris]|uniref:formate/nitrite transporter family protein n=1 Tax=Dietzia maris TaxID=37915 RepID=UPI00223C17F2|nr:formate/nitrite transporter family protein [Dietzia maris]MCT1435398.1 formate/nitrite transporter family protein [Dietzia maris]MCT1522629.1 formate/nitrite transporter family protein [Dietzia maris]
MTAVAPPDIVTAAVEGGEAKADAPGWQLALRGFLAVYLLGAATVLAVVATEATGVAILGAVLFPLGLTMVVLLGWELVTGAYGLVPLAAMEGRIRVRDCLRIFGWMILGHTVGGLAAAWMLTSVLTGMGTEPDATGAQGLVDLAVEKTVAYKEAGVVTGLGWVTLSAVLCNWLVALGVIMSFSSTSTSGKILAIWLPILTFFALGYEHAVVNHFTIPAGMMLGADVSIADWLLWNQIPVHVGNFIGGITLAGLGLYFAQRTRVDRSPGAPAGHTHPLQE